ncbi:MAG: hypothetical protein RLZZ350_94 [Verrucomicrobiota bacterium]|jgi:uncharacterized protein (DUF1697 family)
MPIYIAMLRGINVSGQKLIKMERLRAVLAELGLVDVQTYIQSGNVVFKTAKQSADALAKKIADKILRDFGFPVPALIRTADEMAAVVAANPFLKTASADESKLHVTFLSNQAPAAAEKTLAGLATKSEWFHVCSREIYLCFPAGYGSTKLSNAAIEKKLSVQATTRNWKTVNVLAEMGE